MIRPTPARRAVLGLTAAALPLSLTAGAVREPEPSIVLGGRGRRRPRCHLLTPRPAAAGARLQLVEAGAVGNDRREILQGLAEGDRIVIAGLEQVTEGMTVE